MTVKTQHPKTTESAPQYTLSCVEGVDQSMSPMSCRDRFQVKVNDKPMFELTFDYILFGDDGELQPGTKNGDCTAKVRVLGPDEFHEFPPQVSNGFDLIGKVMNRLNELLSEAEGEFYADCFWDQDGNKVVHSLSF